MKLFPSRTVEERQSDRKDALSVFFVFVVLALAGVRLDEVMAELEKRTSRSGLDEKASRTTG